MHVEMKRILQWHTYLWRGGDERWPAAYKMGGGRIVRFLDKTEESDLHVADQCLHRESGMRLFLAAMFCRRMRQDTGL
jgi:hypothetical protein